MFNEERIWINQVLLYHQDKQYNSNCSIEISISSNTKNYTNYSSATFLISLLSNGSKKVCSLNIQNVVDILTEIKGIYSEKFDGKRLAKRYNNNKNLILDFKLTSTNDEVVEIVIDIGSDCSKIVLPKKTFSTIYLLLKNFAENYTDISFKLINTFISSETLKQIKENNKIVKSIPSSMIEIQDNNVVSRSEAIQISNQTLTNAEQERLQEYNNNNNDESIDFNQSNNDLQELDDFIGGNEMKNINIPEIDNEKGKVNIDTPKQEFESELIYKTLNNDISNFENLINSVYQDENPLSKIIEKIKATVYVDEKFEVLPGIKENELKSVTYISALTFQKHLQNYMIKNVPIPKSVPVIKYKANGNITDKNVDIAYDFLLISLYVKLLNVRVSSKLSFCDGQVDKSILYLASRCFCDVLTFSFLENKNIDSIKNSIVTRFENYSNNGFFKSYEELLDQYGCQKINGKDIGIIIEKIRGVLESSICIDELHKKQYLDGSVKISSENDINLEQITKGIVKLESLLHVSENKNVDEIVAKFAIEVDNKILKIFKENKTHKRREIETNLVRYLKFYKNEIPDKYNDIFEYATTIETDFFNYDKYPLEDLGENIVRGIYNWNEKNSKEKYSDFFSRCENGLNKELIISKVRTKKEIPEANKNDDWLQNLSL